MYATFDNLLAVLAEFVWLHHMRFSKTCVTERSASDQASSVQLKWSEFLAPLSQPNHEQAVEDEL
jgi:hypothetical protein